MSSSDLLNALKDIPPAKIPTLRRLERALESAAWLGQDSISEHHEPKQELSDAVIIQRSRDIASAYKQRTLLYDLHRKTQVGILKPVAGGCRFVYVSRGDITQVVYSFEDLVLTASPPPELKGLPYHFQALAEPITLPSWDAFKARGSLFSEFIDQYHLWRAGISFK
ncbi:hypothetical protein HYT55_02245 [Candidatus Woesearchaeota archaeon]|nr:hypothetical protein [Candidatus Woesearchaeota archaeon]